MAEFQRRGVPVRSTRGVVELTVWAAAMGEELKLAEIEERRQAKEAVRPSPFRLLD